MTRTRLRIGYTCNVRNPSKDADERYSEWEPPETVEAVAGGTAAAYVCARIGRTSLPARVRLLGAGWSSARAATR